MKSQAAGHFSLALLRKATTMPCMNLYLNAKTSLGFWRLVYPIDRRPGASTKVVLDGECACNSQDVQALSPHWVDGLRELGYGKTGICVFSQGQRRRSVSHETSVWSGAIPEGAFYDLGNGSCVASPMFVFLQMAQVLSLAELIALGDELCGLYSLDKSDPRGMRQRECALTSVYGISCFLEAASTCMGVDKAKRALAFVVDNSASPMETADEMLLCLPYRMGGYGLQVPEMNLSIPLGDSAARLAGKGSCKGDLCWEDQGIIIEHQGGFDHTGAKSFGKDRARILALKTEGFNVIELTGDIVHDSAGFEEVALHVARLLGKRIPKKSLGPTSQRKELRKSIFGWNARNGLLRTWMVCR